jgi:internalin A
MKTVVHLIRPLVLALVALASFRTSALARTVSIPDPGLNAAIRSALHIPTAPLTAQDLLTLTNLDASRRMVKSTAGLEAARNLVSLNLFINQLTNFSIPTTLANLSVLDLSANPLTNLPRRVG